MKFCTILIIANIMVLHLAFAQVAIDPYCDPSLCQEGETHIACGNNGTLAAECAANAKVVVMTVPLRKKLLHKHNLLRNFVAGGYIPKLRKALRMATMKWSFSLAEMAKFNALQCVMKHDVCRNTQLYRNSGQNIALSRWSGFQNTVVDIAIQQIQSWYLEYRNITMKEINSYGKPANGAVIGHFAQLMLEPAIGVGCAVVVQKKGNTSEQLTVCNYARIPYISQTVYRVANIAGAGCKTGTHLDYPNLCSAREQYVL